MTRAAFAPPAILPAILPAALLAALAACAVPPAASPEGQASPAVASGAMPHACKAGYSGDLGVFDVPAPERDLRVSLEEDVSRLGSAVRRSRFADRAGDVWIEHTPCYRVVAGVTDLALADDVRRLAPEAIRPYLEVQRTAMNAARWHALQDKVGNLLAAENMAFTAGFDPITDRIVLTLPTDAAIARAKALIGPADLAYVTIQRGSMPVPL